MRAPFVLLSTLLGASALPAEPAALEHRGRDFNKILGKIIALFPVNVAVGVFSDTIVASEALTAAVLGETIVENISGCSDVSLFFARGTFEAPNMGALVGPPVADAVRDALTPGMTVGVQGVEYPASLDDYYNDNPNLGKNMAAEVRKVLAQCPDTKVVLSGYSQGAIVAHRAADELGDAIMSKSVKAVVTFGDPVQHEPVSFIDASRVKVFCHFGDDACNHGSLLLPQHLTYGLLNAGEAAQFIKAQL